MDCFICSGAQGELQRNPGRRLRRCLASLLLALLAVAAAPGIASAQQTPRAKALGLHLKCMCGGCNDTASTCTHSGGAFAGPCDTAKAMLKEIDQRIARGESDGLILQDFVQEYGPTVLVEPPAKGFNWLVWITPVLAPLLALVLIWEVVRRWRRRAALELAGGPPVSPELLDRARREAEKESDE